MKHYLTGGALTIKACLRIIPFWINVTLSWDINSDINIATAKVISALEYSLRFENTCHGS